MIRYGFVPGNPVGHALCPVIMQAACDALGLDARSEESQLDFPLTIHSHERIKKILPSRFLTFLDTGEGGSSEKPDMNTPRDLRCGLRTLSGENTGALFLSGD